MINCINEPIHGHWIAPLDRALWIVPIESFVYWAQTDTRAWRGNYCNKNHKIRVGMVLCFQDLLNSLLERSNSKNFPEISL